jgi:SSS family solute:Na+ symporter
VACFGTTIVVSLLTHPRPADELSGLVYSLTPRPSDEALPLASRPWVLGGVVLALTAALNLVFF